MSYSLSIGKNIPKDRRVLLWADVNYERKKDAPDNPVDLEKTGMLTNDEFTSYKMKLMSEL